MIKRAVFIVVLASCALSSCSRGEPERPHIVLISIDTLRSDHLPAYGYRGVETPALDALRRDGALG